jgi:PadR family transcriptional regulator PadR
MAEDTSELLRGTLSSLVLAALADGRRYGYEIAKGIRTKTDGLLHLKEGSLYPALHAMERDGLLASQWLTVEKGPSRKYYRLTRKGRSALRAHRDRWLRFRNAVDLMLQTRPAEGTT